MKTTLKKEARAAADLFEACADAMENGTQPPLPINEAAAFIRYEYWPEYRRIEDTASRIECGAWKARPEPEALRKAAQLLRRGKPLARAKCPNPGLWVPELPGGGSRSMSRRSAAPGDCIAAAVQVYGSRAGEVLRRQLDTIDPADYAPRALEAWETAASMLWKPDSSALASANRRFADCQPQAA